MLSILDGILSLIMNLSTIYLWCEIWIEELFLGTRVWCEVNMTWQIIERNIVSSYFFLFLCNVMWMNTALWCLFMNDVMLSCYEWCYVGRYVYASIILLRSKHVDVIWWMMVWIYECMNQCLDLLSNVAIVC